MKLKGRSHHGTCMPIHTVSCQATGQTSLPRAIELIQLGLFLQDFLYCSLMLSIYICVSLSHYLIAHLCLAVHTFPQLDIQLKFTFSKSLSQQLLPLHRPQLSLQFLFIQTILSPAVHCPSTAQEGHFKSLSLHSWITGQEKSIITLRLNIITSIP